MNLTQSCSCRRKRCSLAPQSNRASAAAPCLQSRVSGALFRRTIQKCRTTGCGPAAPSSSPGRSGGPCRNSPTSVLNFGIHPAGTPTAFWVRRHWGLSVEVGVWHHTSAPPCTIPQNYPSCIKDLDRLWYQSAVDFFARLQRWKPKAWTLHLHLQSVCSRLVVCFRISFAGLRCSSNSPHAAARVTFLVEASCNLKQLHL